jgi:hypothetical protein
MYIVIMKYTIADKAQTRASFTNNDMIIDKATTTQYHAFMVLEGERNLIAKMTMRETSTEKKPREFHPPNIVEVLLRSTESVRNPEPNIIRRIVMSDTTIKTETSPV